LFSGYTPLKDSGIYDSITRGMTKRFKVPEYPTEDSDCRFDESANRCIIPIFQTIFPYISST
jgi:hypothetical protein